MNTLFIIIKKQYQILGGVVLAFILPVVTYAQNDYVPLVPLPGIDGSGGIGLANYFQQMFILLLSLTTVFAVLMIVIGGLQYMTAGDNASKVSGAKETIQNALYGLFLAIGAWLILYTINPTILSLTIGGDEIEHQSSYGFMRNRVTTATVSSDWMGNNFFEYIAGASDPEDAAIQQCLQKAAQINNVRDEYNIYNIQSGMCTNPEQVTRYDGAVGYIARFDYARVFPDTRFGPERYFSDTIEECRNRRDTIIQSAANLGVPASALDASNCQPYTH
ncbi:MAG: pilin [Candidatus Paceibacterota bacterium]